MKDLHIVIAVATSIILFIFGLENFSKEVQRVTGESFRKFLAKATKVPIAGLGLGALITAFIQSSSATSVIAISLVNAGVLSFKNSLGIIFGANVGTTVTAQLVALKLTAFAPIFIILGFALSLMRNRYSVFAKSLFYFGFVFFTLNLISSTLTPLQDDPRVLEFLTRPQSPFLSLFIGFALTALLQSSSVTTGLTIIFTQQGIISLDNAIPILMGTNLGTTVTAMISIINMDLAAKKTAVAHFFFNLGGVVLFLPIVLILKNNFPLFSEDPSVGLANFHLIFNFTTSFIFILMVNPFAKLIDRLMGEGKMDFQRIDLEALKDKTSFEEIEQDLIKKLKDIYVFLQENYSLVTLSIETNHRHIHEASQKRLEYLDFLKQEIQSYFGHLISQTEDQEEIKTILKIISLYEYIFQIHDSIKDLMSTKNSINENYIILKTDLLLLIRELSGRTLALFDFISKDYGSKMNITAVKEEASILQREIDNLNKDMLKLMAQPNRNDVSFILHILTYSQRLKDKLVNYNNLLAKYSS